MASWLILFVGAIYCYISIDMICAGKAGLSITFLAYALGNVGLWIAARTS
jgi:hypothetical protein